MEVLSKFEGGTLLLSLQGEMDECTAIRTRTICDRLIDQYGVADRIVFDLKGISFMDSTGIGFLIGRYKKATRLNIPVFILEPNLSADKILNMSGIYSLMPKTNGISF